MEIRRLCRGCGLVLSTQDILSRPTIREQALVATENASKGSPFALPTPASELAEMNHRIMDILQSSTMANRWDSVETAMLCSPFQRRMYRAFHHKAEAPYLFSALVQVAHLDGSVSTDNHMKWMLQAWEQTAQRHAMLRTVFVTPTPTTSMPAACVEADLIQVVLKTVPLEIARASRGVSCKEEAIEQSRARLATFRRSAFQNNQPPVSLDIFLVCGGGAEESIYAHLIIGHMLIDHVSLTHVMSDFQMYYSELASEKLPLRPPHLLDAKNNGDFGAYIRQLHMQDRLAAKQNRNWWTGRLRDTPRCIMAPELVGDCVGATAACRHYEMSSIYFRLDVSDRVTRLCAEAEVTLASMLQFAWAVLLHIRTGNYVVCFGHLVSDRDHGHHAAAAGDESEIVGPMLCLSVARAVMSPSDTVVHAMRALQDHNVASLAHMSTLDLTAVEKELLGGDADTIGNPATYPVLFNTLVNYRKIRHAKKEGKGQTDLFRSIWKQDPHEVRCFPIGTLLVSSHSITTPKQQDIVLSFNENGSLCLDAELSYYKHMFSAESMHKTASAYCRIIELLTTHTGWTIQDLTAAMC